MSLFLILANFFLCSLYTSGPRSGDEVHPPNKVVRHNLLSHLCLMDFAANVRDADLLQTVDNTKNEVLFFLHFKGAPQDRFLQYVDEIDQLLRWILEVAFALESDHEIVASPFSFVLYQCIYT